jgi:hypothetical protein
LPTPVKEIPAPGNAQNPDVRSFCDDNRLPGVPRIVQFGMNPITTRLGFVVFTIFIPAKNRIASVFGRVDPCLKFVFFAPSRLRG